MKIKIYPATAETPIPWKLLLDADPSRAEIRKYVRRGELWLAATNKGIIGAMVLMQTRADILEIMNLAVDPKFQSQGIGTQLLKFSKSRARQLKMKKLHVGTGNSSIGQLVFYQRFGFRIFGVDRDFYVPRYGKVYQDGGVKLLDMVRMELEV